VTIGEQTFKLPDPFLVMATQNPIEQEGTYPLPEAQVDRFMRSEERRGWSSDVCSSDQVTIGEQTYKLPEPFLVMATQNPIEQEGTYPLPEAQVDRFMMKVLVGYPTEEEEFVIVERVTGEHLRDAVGHEQRGCKIGVTDTHTQEARRHRCNALRSRPFLRHQTPREPAGTSRARRR